MARLREKPLVSCVPCLYNNDQPSRIKVLFHNVRSLRLHFDDIKCDYKVSEVTLLDTTGTMTLDLWNEQIAQVQIDCVYRFTSLSTSYWNDSKKLSSTINTAIKQSFQPDLYSLQFKESDDTGLQNKHTIIVPVISTVEEVQRYKSCCNCKKRIIQLESTVKCSYCSHMMRASSCPTKLYVCNVVTLYSNKRVL